MKNRLATLLGAQPISSPRPFSLTLAVALAALGVDLLGQLPQATSPRPAAHTAAPDGSDAQERSPDARVSEHQSELLELAFAVASAVPIDPHIKTRSLAQEAVVTACLALDQPRRAQRWADAIGNWRRGVCHAEVALHLARRGKRGEAKSLLAVAARAADAALSDPNAQAWRRERVRAKIAQVYVALGDEAAAARFVGDADAPRAVQRIDADDFAAQLAALDAMFATGGFDEVHSGVQTCIDLVDRFYADGDRRGQVEARIERAGAKLPVDLRFDAMVKLARVALAHADDDAAQAKITAADELLARARWRPEHHIPLLCRLGAVRQARGDRERASADARVALELYEAARDGIVSMERAAALRPIAELWQAIGDPKQALAIYRRAVDDGAENPNARPRAVDLAATCTSMATANVEPDAALWSRLREIRDGLRNPW